MSTPPRAVLLPWQPDGGALRRGLPGLFVSSSLCLTEHWGQRAAPPGVCPGFQGCVHPGATSRSLHRPGEEGVAPSSAAWPLLVAGPRWSFLGPRAARVTRGCRGRPCSPVGDHCDLNRTSSSHCGAATPLTPDSYRWCPGASRSGGHAPGPCNDLAVTPQARSASSGVCSWPRRG